MVGLLPGDLHTVVRSASRALIYRVPGESEQCPACGSSRLYELDLLMLRPAVQGYRTGFVSGCDECGLVFSNPPPTSEQQDRFYSPDGEWGSRRNDAGGPLPASHEREDHEAAASSGKRSHGKSWSWPFAAIRGELSVTAPPAGAKVLDFGCADG